MQGHKQRICQLLLQIEMLVHLSTQSVVMIPATQVHPLHLKGSNPGEQIIWRWASGFHSNIPMQILISTCQTEIISSRVRLISFIGGRSQSSYSTVPGTALLQFNTNPI